VGIRGKIEKFRLPDTGLPPEISELLFVAWIQSFAEQRFGLNQHGGGGTGTLDASYNFGSPVESTFTLKRSLTGSWQLVSVKDLAENDIETIVADAKGKLAAGDFGGEIVYQTALKSPGFSMTPTTMFNFAHARRSSVY
jgi:hypothetical protein